MKRIIALILAFCLFPLTAWAAVDEATTVTANPFLGAVQVSGIAAANELVSIVVTAADVSLSDLSAVNFSASVVAMGEVIGDANGKFSASLTLPAGLAEGDYIAYVSGETFETFSNVFYYDGLQDDANAIYVDYEKGSDEHSGSASKPFKTVKKAQETVRKRKQEVEGDIYVYLSGGVHFLDTPLYMDESDSGTEAGKIIYRAMDGEKPVISGGSIIGGWELYDPAKNIYVADAGEIEDTRQLYVNGKRAVRARSADNMGILTIGDSGCESDVLDMVQWKNQSSMELVYDVWWMNSRCPVSSITEADGKAQLTMQEPGWTYVNDKNRLWGGETGTVHPAYIENAYELLDEPGEWYLDKTEGKFYYMPLDGEDMNEAYVVAARLEKLLELYGTNLDHFAQYIEFHGITFAESTWLRPNTAVGHADTQNNHIRRGEEYRDALAPAAVMVARAKNIVFEKCDFTRLGITGIQMVDGVRDSVIRGGVFYDISGGAINIGRGNHSNPENPNPSDERLYMKNILVNNNYINKIGVEYRSASAISGGFPVDCEFSHNEISDIPYSGFHMGYGWDENQTTVLSGVKILNNYIHNVLNKEQYDGGAIYTLGATGGTEEEPNLISGNYIKDQYNDSNAIYNDHSSTYWHHTNNVVDLRGQERTKWHNGRIPTWMGCTIGGIYGGISYDNNYTTTIYHNRSNPDVTRCKVTNTHVVPNAHWPKEAWDIINQAGLTAEYADLLYENINLGDSIASGTDWTTGAGSISGKTIQLSQGQEATYTANALDSQVLYFYMKQTGENFKTKINLTAENGGYEFVFQPETVVLQKTDGTVLQTVSAKSVTDGKRNELALRVLIHKGSTELTLLLNNDEVISYEEEGIEEALSLTIAAETGEVAFGRVEEMSNMTQLVKNYDFEEETTFEDEQEWYTSGMDASLYTEDYVSGNNSVLLNTTAKWGSLIQRFTIEQEKYYDFSVWIKLLENSEENADYAEIVLYQYYQSDGGATPDYEYIAVDTPLVKEEWVQLRGSFHNTQLDTLLMENNAALMVRVGSGKGEYQYLLDDFSVTEVKPEANNLALSGEFEAGGVISATYDYYNEYGITEHDSQYALYVADNPQFDNPVLLEEGFMETDEDKSFTLPSYIAKPYIKMTVLPIDSMGYYGAPAASEVYMINQLISLQVEETDAEFLISVQKGEEFLEKDMRIILAAYNGGRLIAADLDAGNNDFCVVKSAITAESVVKAFVWKRELALVMPISRAIEICLNE